MMNSDTTTTSPTTTPYGVRTAVTCTKCSKETTVPFTPTPGRPVFCRDCFVKQPAGGGAGPGRGPPRGGPYRPEKRAAEPRKRMMAQGRKTHFIYDSRKALDSLDGGMDEKDQRAFLEGVFARGARISEEAAQEFLDEKEAAEVITPDQRDALGRLVQRYSFYR